MRHIAIFAATLGTVLALALPAPAGMVENCNQSQDEGRRILGCTGVIRSGDFSGQDLAAAYNNRGFAYDDRGEYARAIEDFDEAVRINPDYAIAFNNRGVAYDNLGEYARAIEDYDEALRVDRGYVKAHYNRGNAYDELGEYSRAILDYSKALRIDPDYASAYQNRGVSYESLGQFRRAAADWEKAIRIGGASRATWWQDYMKDKGHYSGAIDGIFGPVTRRGLLACARDPNC